MYFICKYTFRFRYVGIRGWWGRDRWGKCYWLEGEYPSIKILGNSPFGVFSLLWFLLAVDSSSFAIASLAILAKNLSKVSCFRLRCKIFLKCIIALSLNISVLWLLWTIVTALATSAAFTASLFFKNVEIVEFAMFIGMRDQTREHNYRTLRLVTSSFPLLFTRLFSFPFR